VERSFAAAKERRMMSVRDDVKLLHSRGGVEERVKVEPEADIANLRAAVHELQATVVFLAEELDRRDAATDG
jgi:hypothetical protein